MENNERYYIKKYGKEKVERAKEIFRNATIRDDFIFCKVMELNFICMEVLRRILKKIIKIKSIIPQSTIENSKDRKSIRLDILVEDEDCNFYDIEMQVVNSDSVPKRMRIYQASIDIRGFGKAQKYKEATKTIIIFVCMFDPIGKGRAVYTFKNLCVEDPSIELGDETLKIILVLKEWQKETDEELKALLRYIYEGVPSDEFTREVDMQVENIKYEQVISNDSLSFLCRMEDERDMWVQKGMQKGIQKGIQEGMQKGMQEGIQKGIQEGAYKANIATARKLLKKKFSIEDIADATGLKEDEILKLK